MALDAIATPTLVESIPAHGKVLWCITGIEADASTAIEIKAAPGVGNAIYITHVILQSDDADANPQLQDEDDNVLIGAPYTTVEGVILNHKFENPLKLVSNKALELKAGAGGQVFVHVEGAIATG